MVRALPNLTSPEGTASREDREGKGVAVKHFHLSISRGAFDNRHALHGRARDPAVKIYFRSL